MPDTTSLIGDNLPPLDTAAQLPATLERTYEDLVTRAMNLEMEEHSLPKTCETDEDSEKLADYIVKRRALYADADKARLDIGKPYREGQAAANAWFGAILTPAETAIKTLTQRIDAYRRAKAAREAAEREAARLEQLKIQREAEAEAQRKRDEAAAAQKAADEAEAKLRQAATDAERAEAEAEMRHANQKADAALQQADVAQADVVMAEERGAAIETAKPAGRATAGGATLAGSTRWDFSVTGHTELIASLGVLGKWLTPEAINAAIRAAIREGVRDGIPGVLIAPETNTVVRGKRS